MDTTILRIVLGVIALAAAVYLIWPQVAVWLDRVKQPVCGKCRYAVAGVASLTCPECGSDLREAGILTPGMMMRRAPGRRTWVAGWTLLWALSGVIATVAVSMLMQGKLRAVRSSPVTSVADSATHVEIVQTAEGWSDPPAERVIELKLRHDTRAGEDGVIAFTWPQRGLVRAEGSASGAAREVSGREVDSGMIERWLDEAGLKPSSDTGSHLLDAVAGVAAQPVNMATDVPSSASWRFTGSSIGVRRYTPWWVQAAGGAAWLAVWLVGAIAAARWAGRRARGLSRGQHLGDVATR